MTPAALPFETPLPKAKFRNIQQSIFGGGPKVVNGVKKTIRAKKDNKKPSCLEVESCEEEDDHQSEKRRHYYSSLKGSALTVLDGGAFSVPAAVWRAEWSYGIQIPLRADAVNPSEVRKARIERSPSRLNRVQKERRELVAEFNANTYKPIATSPLRLYECCPLDERWVQLYNENHKLPGHALPMEVFLQIMNDFEVECYKIDSEPDDEMVFCDGCNLCVHMSCYGLQELPPNEWMCMKCRLSFGRNPPCVLCPTIGGALKCTDTKNEWAHVVCALWIPECRFGDFEKREPIIRIHEIHEDRWSAKFVTTLFFPTSQEKMSIQDQVDDRVHMISLCPKHRSAKPFAANGGASESNQAASDDETEGQCSLGLLSKLEQTCYSFVDHVSVAARMKLDPVVVADVFAYWVRKRLQLNHGKPLIDNLQDEIKVKILRYISGLLRPYFGIAENIVFDKSNAIRGLPRYAFNENVK
ncbi:unnamed protein product [Heligmosomoides polygyrus]|uniref:PHD-type domain-containing protein n=1 Tax=Heligmosomoides polygyrus TaxID=6339 RepID=A0A183GLW2_HELPZ|nr:unnamed protein product [Heligmosomoides polygyrus]